MYRLGVPGVSWIWFWGLVLMFRDLRVCLGRSRFPKGGVSGGGRLEERC